ncbi:MAG: hypothetical protein ACKVVP_07145 [Chloroflexota bacterium]
MSVIITNQTTAPLPDACGGASTRSRGPTSGVLASLTPAVFVVALLTALLHMAPYWRAQSQVPPGWTFTGNTRVSPDYMQYRVWTRQTQQTGVLVSDQFTSEPNEPHLLVLFYYAVGQISLWTGLSPETVYAHLGSIFTFALTLLLFAGVRAFMKSPSQAWWVFLAILLGGGLGAHLKILSYIGEVSGSFLLERLLVEPLRGQPTFDDFRFAYVFVTLFDTHTALNWLGTMAAVLSFYFTLRDYAAWRVALTAGLYAGMTLLHLYEGITLLLITAAVAAVYWRKGLAIRPALVTLAACTVTVALSLGGQWLLYHSSGLPVTSWRAKPIPFSVLFLAYPLAWVVIAWGFFDYWQKAGPKECFLLGWALGCSALILSGPFFPYPDRGAMTLQCPLFVIAGTIYFTRHSQVTARAALVAICLLGAGPVFELVARHWVPLGFRTDAPYMYMSTEHREIVDSLRQHAQDDDVLLADDASVLWLAPEYQGKHYAGHFFLTVDYERKRAEVARFYDGASETPTSLLKREGIRFVYVPAGRGPDRFQQLPDLSAIIARPVGTLFEYRPERLSEVRALGDNRGRSLPDVS